ncbi:hypothetical protein F5Y12DRAFT_309108 [Xylaria sp. FL1777]|nr:hypothetical protein F5Y12DRAFT_309108 [Xylaria sp. FL1777]
MRFDAMIASIIIYRTVQSLPISRRLTLSRRLDSSTCDFYGYMEDMDIYNEYTINMAGWGNDGSTNSCAPGIPINIQTQCETGIESFTCTQIENLHETQISFRMKKAEVAQPGCVTEALRLVSSSAHDEQTIQCFCLAECWASQKRV